MNPFEFILAIIVIVSVVRVIRYRMGDRAAFEKPWIPRRDRDGHKMGMMSGHDEDRPDGETMRLRDEVRQLKERLHVLERIAVDKENSLARQIDELREPRP